MQQDTWAPNIKTALLAFLAIRTLSAAFNPNVIADCDEVFNYWEPTHYIAHGYGFQTWEYRYLDIIIPFPES
jgi:alpha-1,2-mannosyltransferase